MAPRSIKARLHMRFLMQLLSHFSMQFLSRSSCVTCTSACKLASISVRFVAAISHLFRTCSKLDAICDLLEIKANVTPLNCSEIATSLHLRQKLHSFGERDKNHIKNRACKRTLRKTTVYENARADDKSYYAIRVQKIILAKISCAASHGNVKKGGNLTLQCST